MRYKNYFMSFTLLGNILSKNLSARSGLKKQILAVLVCEEFDKIVQHQWGAKMDSKIKALFLKDNMLTIASLSSIASQEIKLHEREILDQINQKFGTKIERIRYLV